MIQQYLAGKASWSRWIAQFNGRKLVPLPHFVSHEELALYMANNFVYVPDPAGGALDFYTHPERTQWEIDTRTHAYPCDCDDYAVYAHKALKAMPGYEPRIETILDGWIKWSHVVCVFRGQGRSFVIDTNGLNELGAGLTLSQERAALLTLMGRLYDEAHYFGVIDTPYPFST